MKGQVPKQTLGKTTIKTPWIMMVCFFLQKCHIKRQKAATQISQEFLAIPSPEMPGRKQMAASPEKLQVWSL